MINTATDYWSWHFAMGRSPDGWVVIFATNHGMTDDEIRAKGLHNAEMKEVDPDTVRVVHTEDATPEEIAIFDNFMSLMLIKLEKRRMARQAAAASGDKVTE
ncbi:MAG TPA: hypothetical protein VIG30_09665 [Ktedonobacterales bacterium]|jgi:hypothetical protein